MVEKVGKNAREGTESGHPATANSQRLNVGGMLYEFNKVLRVICRGEVLPAGSVLVLAIIQQENIKTGLYCSYDVLYSQFGKNSRNGNYVSILESKGLINRPHLNAYSTTIEGDLLLKSIHSDLTSILQSKPLKAKPRKTRRPPPPLETFNALVREVLYKAGMNKKVKYALLRTLGMKGKQAREVLKQITPLKHTDRIKPILKEMLSDLIKPQEAK